MESCGAKIKRNQKRSKFEYNNTSKEGEEEEFNDDDEHGHDHKIAFLLALRGIYLSPLFITAVKLDKAEDETERSHTTQQHIQNVSMM